MAAGRLFEFAQRLSRLHQSDIFTLTAGLSSHERGQVMGDWSRAESIVHYELQLKTGCWQRLPHLLFAIGLDNEEESR